MGNKKWTRLLALCLAAVCTFTVVFAAGTAYDANGDSKYTVWDLQKLFTNNSESYDATLEEILGGKDELNPKTVDGETVYYIASELGLRNMAKNAGEDYTFVLVDDIDLGGMDWTPVHEFKGTFNGNGKTISNFKITHAATDGGASMGFFGSTANVADDRTEINDLHLRDMQIIVDAVDDEENENSTVQFVGAVVGTNRGDIKNCTAISTVIDKRQATDKTIYYGSIAGRNTNLDGVALGTITGTNELTPVVNIAEASKSDTDLKLPEAVGGKVNSMMATLLSDELDYETKKSNRKVGIAGSTKTSENGNVEDLLWQDLTNSTDLVGEGLQTRRETAVDEMYKMCTVLWTPVQDLNYYRYDVQKDVYKTYEAGSYYRGIPYNYSSTGMDRFLSVMDENGDGTYTTKSTLPTEAYYIRSDAIIAEINEAKAAGKTTTTSGYRVPATLGADLVAGAPNQVGFNMYIGADCSSQTGWAWRKVSAVNGDDFFSAPNTANMYPTYGDGTNETNNIKKRGIVPVNGMTFDYAANDAAKNAAVSAALKADMAANGNKPIYFWDTLALTSKGDCLMNYDTDGGHTRMAQGDAVVIRSYNGVVDGDKSYIYLMEQGASGVDSDRYDHYAGDGWTSSCSINRRMTFRDLTIANPNVSTGNYDDCYFPITCDALRTEDSVASKAIVSLAGNNTTSAKPGTVRGNWHIVSITANGETYYTGIAQTGHRNPVTDVYLPDIFGEIAEKTPVTVRLANGKDYAFSYGTYKRYAES